MILKILYLLLLLDIYLCLPLAQDFDAALWSMTTDNGNARYDPVFFHQSEISQINGLADLSVENKQYTQINCENENHKQNFQYNNIESIDPSISNEELYVFLDKGRTRYMPLNEHEQMIVGHSPMNVNGRDVHLSDLQVLQNVGLNHEVLNDRTHSPYPYYPANQQNYEHQSIPYTQNQASNYYKKPLENYKQYQQNHQSHRNALSNIYNQRVYDRSQYQQQYMKRNHQSSRKRGCKKNKNNKNRRVYTKNNQYISNKNKPKFIRDCKSKRKNKIQHPKNKAIIHQTDYRVEYTQADVILGSTQNKSDNFHNNVSGNPILGQQHSPQNEKSFTTVHQGVVKVSSPSDMQVTTNNAENDVNKSFEALIENDTPSAIQTESPLLGSTLLTDSPIYYIKIKNPTKKKQKSDIFNTTEKSKDLLNNEVKDMKSNSPNDAVLGRSEIEKDLQNDDITTPIEEDQKSTVTTEVNELTNSERLLLENTDRSTDLAGSENRLYSYITKLEKKPRKSRIKKVRPMHSKYMEPIAYEANSMQPTDKSKKTKIQYTDKPKRFADLKSSGPNNFISMIPRKTTVKTTTTTTTIAPKLLTTKSALLLQNSDAVDYKENADTERSFSERRGNIFKNSNNDINNSQLLGSNRFLSNDPCIDNEEYSQNFNEYDRGENQLYDSQYFDLDNSDSSPYDFSESGIHGIRDEDDCNDSTEVKYDGDQFFDLADNVTPASFQSTYSEYCP